MAEASVQMARLLILLLITLASLPCLAADDDTELLYLIKVVGELEIYGESVDESYESYFQIPIATAHQLPLSLEFHSPELVDWRYLRRDGPNLVAVATLRRAGRWYGSPNPEAKAARRSHRVG